MASEFCYIGPNWHTKGSEFIERAMTQINNNIDLVEDWFTDAGLDGSCVLNLLTAAGDGGGFLHFRRDESSVHACGFKLDWRGCTIPGSTIITLSAELVNALANDSATDGGGNRACMVADLASTIIHETMHSCFYSRHKKIILNQQHYYDAFIARQGYTSGSCCVLSPAPASYDPADYADLAAAEAIRFGQAIAQDSDGTWHTQGCGGF